jgi:hypothetical protein
LIYDHAILQTVYARLHIRSNRHDFDRHRSRRLQIKINVANYHALFATGDNIIVVHTSSKFHRINVSYTKQNGCADGDDNVSRCYDLRHCASSHAHPTADYMKLTTPKMPAEYLQRTEHAVRHAYSGLAFCWSHYQQALQHTTPPVAKDGNYVLEPPQTPEERAKLDRSLELLREHFELKISEAMFAGFILQVAHMAIRLYSRNETIPPNCARFVEPSQKTAIPFCIGKECHGIPTGLAIYAGRNQYNHWDEEESHPVTTKIFNALSAAFVDNPFSDLAFDLGNPTIPIYASEILFTALGWNSYEKYFGEMTELLTQLSNDASQRDHSG